MAKTKEQKQLEAVERAKSHYLEHDFPTWLNKSPVGHWWESNNRWYAEWLSDTESLLRKAQFANVNIYGHPERGDSLLVTWPALELIQWILASGNLLELATVYIEYLTTHNILSVQDRLHLDVNGYSINAQLALPYYMDVK